MSLKQQMQVDLPSNIHIERPKFQKMLFVSNALEQGWSIKKDKDTYIFSKKHNGVKEVFMENYLEKLISTNNDVQTIIDNMKQHSKTE